MRIKKLFFGLLLFVFVLAGCQSAEPVIETNIAKHEYQVAFGQAVCGAMKKLNSEGLLASDGDFLAEKLEEAVREKVLAMGYDADEWLSTKKKYFTKEEHEKLLKLHFTWCLIGDSLTDVSE